MSANVTPSKGAGSNAYPPSSTYSLDSYTSTSPPSLNLSQLQAQLLATQKQLELAKREHLDPNAAAATAAGADAYNYDESGQYGYGYDPADASYGGYQYQMDAEQLAAYEQMDPEARAQYDQYRQQYADAHASAYQYPAYDENYGYSYDGYNQRYDGKDATAAAAATGGVSLQEEMAEVQPAQSTLTLELPALLQLPKPAAPAVKNEVKGESDETPVFRAKTFGVPASTLNSLPSIDRASSLPPVVGESHHEPLSSSLHPTPRLETSLSGSGSDKEKKDKASPATELKRLVIPPIPKLPSLPKLAVTPSAAGTGSNTPSILSPVAYGGVGTTLAPASPSSNSSSAQGNTLADLKPRDLSSSPSPRDKELSVQSASVQGYMYPAPAVHIQPELSQDISNSRSVSLFEHTHESVAAHMALSPVHMGSGPGSVDLNPGTPLSGAQINNSASTNGMSGIDSCLLSFFFFFFVLLFMLAFFLLFLFSLFFFAAFGLFPLSRFILRVRSFALLQVSIFLFFPLCFKSIAITVPLLTQEEARPTQATRLPSRIW